MFGCLQLRGKKLSQFVNVDLLVGRMSDDAHQSCLQRFDLASLGQKPLQVIIDLGLLSFELLIIVL